MHHARGVSGCSAYKKVASLAANQQAIPQSSEPAATPHQATPETQNSRAAAETGGQEGTEGILAHSQEPEQHEGPSKALPTSLFRGAMRRLAGKESQGAQHVQVSCIHGSLLVWHSVCPDSCEQSFLHQRLALRSCL